MGDVAQFYHRVYALWGNSVVSITATTAEGIREIRLMKADGRLREMSGGIWKLALPKKQNVAALQNLFGGGLNAIIEARKSDRHYG